MRICKTKSGKFLEAQSDATEGTLITNAVGGGYKAEELIESVISQSEFDKLMRDLSDQSLTYSDKRKAEYESIGASIEECVHAILDNELDALQVKRQAVKKKYPKENN